MAKVQNDEKGGSRVYFRVVDPDRRYPSVTATVDMLPKKFLMRWYANMAAELALDSIDYLQRMVDRDRPGAKKWVAGAAWRYTNDRAGIGSKAHDLFERMIRGQQIRRQSFDLEPYRANFRNFLDTVKPVLVRAEDVAWSDTHQYAGSFDGWLRLRVILEDDGTWTLDPDNVSGRAVWVDVIADWKTSKSVWPSVALQMSAYAHADKIIDPDGTEEPMPDFDGAVVLHITPDGWDLIRVRIDRDDVFAAFLHLRNTLDWERALSRTVLVGSLAKNKGALTGTERRG
ncbi:hypothetical protein [Streptomyces sp. NBC_01500]|uniref:hypothetical protein n=1 Tax=Streptomyces sp. NBC_01500 TaxID=2903886 RepID=UPI00225B1A28|nr:hypothetical protein [Streptomyces sp. NBC_01500]MCX4547268.1 hypothetical protein [Streptomyces sp. NBC_01500]MCX4554188.1 hypothetical protein [Streptomyces sp. NBC_01500]MCX4554528.1 hypothetical protein [Streptomyces sp. NBC_01500]